MKVFDGGHTVSSYVIEENSQAIGNEGPVPMEPIINETGSDPRRQIDSSLSEDPSPAHSLLLRKLHQRWPKRSRSRLHRHLQYAS